MTEILVLELARDVDVDRNDLTLPQPAEGPSDLAAASGAVSARAQAGWYLGRLSKSQINMHFCTICL